MGVIEGMLQSPPLCGGLPIPEYFANPKAEADIPLSELAALYFRRS